MDEVIIFTGAVPKVNIYLYLLAVLATYLLIKYHRRKNKQPMPTKKQILEAAATYANAEVTLDRAAGYTERREALFNSYTSWDNLEKLVTEATEGPF